MPHVIDASYPIPTTVRAAAKHGLILRAAYGRGGRRMKRPTGDYPGRRR